ncbi:Signal transducer regulating beta-lactamase production, contains metallopeptidase domain [Peptoclostridium litorale DSM 5388]|uniref:Regulatory protein BlaR1 n=1 Tax=Peptoclostridium litorale DSM 5388 TaxID=1121324 RepID=A0A069RMU2_PEPLI|nr:M56 family metallopeptidase [Peptoclostridium litorale]KDR95502.1 regulatory protein BlaR1 [Peptoclostridium litorale DSM 5388]SIO17320.1 Signal transducer regulating beta-lactamase production, contains metallopeptidase domain [Peptoclostridium litorale DSM 5388]
MNNFAALLALMSLKTCMLFAAIAAVKKLLGKLLTPSLHYIVWFLLFASLTLPSLPKSDISIYTLFDVHSAAGSGFKSQDIFLGGKGQSNLAADLFYEENPHAASEASAEKNSNSAAAGNGFNIANSWAFVLWAAGTLCFACISLFSMRRSIITAKSEAESSDFALDEMLAECREKLNVKKDVKAVFSKKFSSPCLFGVINPVIFIPESLKDIEHNKLEMILLHELAHCKRNDIVINISILIYQCIYWFNPVVVYAFQMMKSDMEPACDSIVIEIIGMQNAKEYGMVLLDTIEKISIHKSSPLTAGISENKKQLKRRILMIGKHSKKSKLAIVTGILAMLLVGCGFLSEPTGKVSNETPASENTTQVEGSEQSENAREAGIVAGEEMTRELAESFLSNKDGLAGSNSPDSLERFNPYISTYYVGLEHYKSKDISTDFVSESVYPIKSSEESSGLYVCMDSESNILDIKIDEFNGMTSKSYAKSKYIVTFYARMSGLYPEDDGFSDDDILGFSGSIYEFDEKFKTGGSAVTAKKSDMDLELHFYPVYVKESGSAVGGVYVLTDDSNIVSIFTDLNQFRFENLERYFSYPDKNMK